MSVAVVLLAALFLAIPITAKYITSFKIHALADALRRRERQIELMCAQLDALDLEREVVARAVRQVQEQRRWSLTRRDLAAAKLHRGRHRTARSTPAFRPETPPVWEPASSTAASETTA